MNRMNESSDNIVSKEWITRFISKYYLNGIFNDVRWNVVNGKVEVKEMNQSGRWKLKYGKWNWFRSDDDRKLMVVVNGPFNVNLPPMVIDTRRLLKYLNCFNDILRINHFDPSDYGLEYVMCPHLEIEGDGVRCEMICNSEWCMGPQPKLNSIPKWDFSDTFNTRDMLKYMESKRRRFHKKQIPLFIFGPVEWFNFNGYHLNQILKSNTDVTVFTMNISKQGLCHLSFKNDIECDYYLMKRMVEDDG
jgi:hypothetical protein